MKTIIGTTEVISIIDLELIDLDVKIDTGADSSALHCDEITLSSDEKMVSFTLLQSTHSSYHGKRLTIPVYTIKKVRSSNGQLQIRPSIKVNVKFFGKSYTSVISLTNRADMKFPMLIGKEFLHGRFLVDVSQEYLSKKV